MIGRVEHRSHNRAVLFACRDPIDLPGPVANEAVARRIDDTLCTLERESAVPNAVREREQERNPTAGRLRKKGCAIDGLENRSVALEPPAGIPERRDDLGDGSVTALQRDDGDAVDFLLFRAVRRHCAHSPMILIKTRFGRLPSNSP